MCQQRSPAKLPNYRHRTSSCVGGNRRRLQRAVERSDVDSAKKCSIWIFTLQCRKHHRLKSIYQARDRTAHNTIFSSVTEKHPESNFMSSCVVSRLQARTFSVCLEIQTLSNTVVHLWLNQDGFTSIWGVNHSVCQSSDIIWHHLTSEQKMKWDFYSNNLERPQNISSNFVTLFSLKVSSSLLRLAGFFRVLTLVQWSLVVFCTSAALHTLPCFWRWSQARFSGVFFADFATVQMLLRESAAALRQFLCEEIFQSSQR